MSELPLRLCIICGEKKLIRVLGLRERGAGIWSGKYRFGSDAIGVVGAYRLSWWSLVPFHPINSRDSHDHVLDRVPVAALGDEAVGWFEVLICRACGYTAWFARAFERLLAGSEQKIQGCAICGGDKPHLKLVPVQRGCGTPARPGGLTPYDDREISVCTSCGVTSWRLRDVDRAKPGYWNDYHDAPGACRLCADPRGAKVVR